MLSYIQNSEMPSFISISREKDLNFDDKKWILLLEVAREESAVYIDMNEVLGLVSHWKYAIAN